MSTEQDLEDSESQVEQRIDAELRIVETLFNFECVQLAKLLADAELVEGERRAEIERIAAEHGHDAMFKLFLGVSLIPGITIDRAKAAVNDIQDRAGLEGTAL